MAALADATGETINVAVASPGGVEHLAQVESRHYLGTSHWVGRRVPYHCSANGKVLLAFAAAGAAEGALEPHTSRTITEPAIFAAELETIRREGYATAVDELELGLSAVAAPVLDESGRAIAALSISGPTLRLSPRRVAELRPIVIKQARALPSSSAGGPERSARRMTHDEILTLLYEETLVGNAPAVKEGVEHGLADGPRARDDALRRADPLARGGGRAVRAR